jgi:hypothetical protein
MKQVNSELKKVVSRVKTAQSKFETFLKKQDWVEDARHYAEKQSKEVKKLLSSDVTKLKSFIEKERKELDRIQKQIPGEITKLRKFVTAQRKDFEKLLANVRKTTAAGRSKKAKKSGTSKKKSSSRAASA